MPNGPYEKGVWRIEFPDLKQVVTLRLAGPSALDEGKREAKKYLYDCGIVPRPTSREAEAAIIGRITVSRVRAGEPVEEGLSPLEDGI